VGFLFPKPDINADKVEKLDHIQLSSSAYGQCVPIVYGTQRVAPVLIWSNEFTPHEEKKPVGKGGSQDVTSYTYTGCIQFGVCEGQITSYIRLWDDKLIKRFGLTGAVAVPFEATSLGPRSNPTPWAHLTSVHAADALGYGGTAWIAAASLALPNGGLANYSVEVRGFQATRAAPTFSGGALGTIAAFDAHPADIIVDLFSNKEYGLAWDPAKIGVAVGTDGLSTSSYTNYCHALGFYLSAAMDKQQTGLQWLQQFLEATNSAAVWSQGVLKILPYGDTSATGNSFTYTPNLTTVYDLGVDDFLPVADMDPVQVERINLQDTYNSVPVEWLDREHDYKPIIADDPEQADVEAFGLRRADPLQAHFVCRKDVALALSRLRAQKNIWVRNKFSFKLPQRYVLLEPMDLVTLTEPKLGLVQKVVRLVGISEDTDGNFECVAEEWPFGTGTHTLYTPQTGDGITNDFLADPGDATAPIAFIPTLQLSKGSLQLWLATAGGANWGGADVYVSDDTTTFEFAGSTLRGRWGTLVNNISNSATTVDIDLSASSGVLASTSATGAADNLTAIWIGNEVISYQTATLTGSFTYQLTGVLRGRMSTTAAAHTAGDLMVRLDEGVFKHDIAYNRLGTNIYVKLVSFNKSGLARQDISALSYYTFAIPAAPALLPTPSSVTITIQGTEF
jgi:hypothetical protein